MIFRQLFHAETSTYTYLLGSLATGEALLIDPVVEDVNKYLGLLEQLNLKLVRALDTHVHADHVTALGTLRERTGCETIMGLGPSTKAECATRHAEDGDDVGIPGIDLRALYTPGHTDDSYCYLMDDRVFTGDTLLIRGTGRTDFQNGDAHQQYNSLFEKLLTLPEDTLVYPGHDYKGFTMSTIGEEKRHNPRLQVHSVDEYVDIMEHLNLPSPKYMDVAVPANLTCGNLATAP